MIASACQSFCCVVVLGQYLANIFRLYELDHDNVPVVSWTHRNMATVWIARINVDGRIDSDLHGVGVSFGAGPRDLSTLGPTTVPKPVIPAIFKSDVHKGFSFQVYLCFHRIVPDEH